MTREISGPSAPSTAAPDAWDRQLADAFAALLGRPLGEYDPDAVYAARIGGNLIDEAGFLRDPEWVRPAALRGALPVVWDCPVFDESDRSPVFDAGGSVFGVGAMGVGAMGERAGGGVPEGGVVGVPEASGAEPSALPEGFAGDVADVCFSPGLVRGADLAPLLERHGVDLADPALAGTWRVLFPRLVSDGTLLGALCAALDTGRTPGDLVPFTTGPGAEWAGALASVAHPGLRAHLGHFCTDGEEGLMPVHGSARAGLGEGEEGCVGVAGWEDMFGQIELAVVRLSDRVAGRL
ncbi:hypothetical protein AB0O01_27620 [Streptomyces sp. NPDC093252]|uniref:hypothetical protein n=1 Tax=Streptomyces sp. NPDC093252 TaxID=3154980 RepID=UPI0034428687